MAGFQLEKIDITRFVLQPLEQVDNVCRYLVDSPQGIFAWLETYMKAEFERQSQDFRHLLRQIQVSLSIYDSLRCSREVRTARVPVDTICC